MDKVYTVLELYSGSPPAYVGFDPEKALEVLAKMRKRDQSITVYVHENNKLIHEWREE